VNVLLWHVHGSWTTALVQGRHRYLLPLLPGRGADGRGRARTWDWPDSAVELAPDALRNEEVDAVILQRPHELDLVERWLGRRPGRDLPALYLEHDAPQGEIGSMRHPLAGRADIPVVHVTHFNDLFWDCGRAPTRVVEHGVVDPGYRYSGELPRSAVVINEAPRRGRVVGLDLLPRLGAEVPIDLFGMGNAGTSAPPAGLRTDDLPQARLHAEMPRRRLYVHPYRWTSLGLALIEAMHLGMPVVALGTTEAAEAVPAEAGVVSTDLEVLGRAVRRLAADPDEARAMGRAARAAAIARYSASRFLADWDRLLDEVTRR
jgi:glycosyltransferase involved in cell wall biosynthesis